MSIGMLILRLVVGLTFAAHGAQKLFGWFGGPGLSNTGGFFELLGFVPGRRRALSSPPDRFLRLIRKGFGRASTLKESLQIGVRQTGWEKMPEKPVGANRTVAV